MRPRRAAGDEPFGALDAQARELLQNEVQRVWVESDGRKTFVFVTHNVREAALLADRGPVMTRAPGRLLERSGSAAPRPRDLDDVLVAARGLRHPRLLMKEVDEDVSREMGSLGSSARRSRDRRARGDLGDRARPSVDSSSLPSPLEVWRAFLDGLRARHDPGGAAAKTLIRLAFSFAVAIAIGTAIGFRCSATERVRPRRSVRPLVVALQIAPPIAWLPLAVVWFGLSERAVVFVAIVGSFPPVALGTISAFRQVPPLCGAPA
jgi:hypothetical protein